MAVKIARVQYRVPEEIVNWAIWTFIVSTSPDPPAVYMACPCAEPEKYESLVKAAGYSTATDGVTKPDVGLVLLTPKITLPP